MSSEATDAVRRNTDRGRSARTTVKAILWNAQTRRPRLPWRLLLGLVVIFLVGNALYSAVRVLFPPALPALVGTLAVGTPDPSAVETIRTTALGITTNVIVLACIYLAARLVDRRLFSDFGLRFDRQWWRDLGFGFALGAFLVTSVFLVELALGWVTVTGTFVGGFSSAAFWPWFAVTFAFLVTIAVYEELLLRGILLTNLAEGLPWFDRVSHRTAVAIAVAVSSVVFGLVHLQNPNSSLVSTTGIVLAGVVLAAGYVLTGELGVSIGLHLSWNFVMGCVFGFPVSGTTAWPTLVAVEQHGPAVMTGGAFGPEAGLLGMLSLLLGLALIAAWARLRDGTVALSPAVWTPDLRTRSAS